MGSGRRYDPVGEPLGYTYADGSNQAMGLTNVFVTHTLRRTGTDFWVLADNC